MTLEPDKKLFQSKVIPIKKLLVTHLWKLPLNSCDYLWTGLFSIRILAPNSMNALLHFRQFGFEEFSETCERFILMCLRSSCYYTQYSEPYIYPSPLVKFSDSLASWKLELRLDVFCLSDSVVVFKMNYIYLANSSRHPCPWHVHRFQVALVVVQ